MEKDFIKDLFADKLANAEAPVNPELWNAISAKVASQTTASAGTLSATAKIIIGLGTAATITVASILYFNGEEKTPQQLEKTELTQQQEVSENLPDGPSPEENKLAKETKSKKNDVQPWSCASFQIGSQELIFDQYIDTNSFRKERKDKVVYDPETNMLLSIAEADPVAQKTQPSSSNSVKANAAVKDSVEQLKTRQNEVQIGELPNIFTPNNDSENDFFFVPVKGIQDFALTVLNQDNEPVFRTSDPNFKWDGRDAQGNLIPSGSKLVYFFTGKSSQGDTISRHNRLEIRY